MASVQVKLIRKLAEIIDDVDTSDREVGDTFRIPEDKARLLVAERWADIVEPKRRGRPSDGNALDDDSRRSYLRQSLPPVEHDLG